MNKSVSVGVVGSGTIGQGTQQESTHYGYWVTGRQTLVQAVEPAGTCKPATGPLWLGKSRRVMTWADTHNEWAFVEVHLS